MLSNCKKTITMTKVYSASPENGMRICVGPEVMNRKIIECIAVLRPLDTPSTYYKYGKVLSHSAVLCRTKYEYVLIEYMNVNLVLINRVGCFKDKNGNLGDSFFYHGYSFNYVSTLQKPSKDVTIGLFAEKMVHYMEGKPFDTFTHNCHHARYLTMKHFGMKSDDPYNIKYNVLFQGVVDYFKPYDRP